MTLPNPARSTQLWDRVVPSEVSVVSSSLLNAGNGSPVATVRLGSVSGSGVPSGLAAASIREGKLLSLLSKDSGRDSGEDSGGTESAGVGGGAGWQAWQMSKRALMLTGLKIAGQFIALGAKG